MANRTGTYVAFDGLGESDPTKSDFRYYGMIQAWAAHKTAAFRYVNSHDKTYAVRDSSRLETLKARIRERLAASKNMVVILSKDTRPFGSMLSYEIEQAVDRYDLPLIITYVGFEVVLEPHQLSSYWPNSLSDRIYSGNGSMIHIPFDKNPIADAISQFSVHDNRPNGGPLGHYCANTHRSWGLLYSLSPEKNYLKA